MEAALVESQDIQQRPGGAVVKVRSARGKSSEHRSLDFADMIEAAIDESLSEICCRFAVVSRRSSVWVFFAYRDPRQIT